MSNIKADLQSEALAFDQRITERISQGFIPDLRRAKKTDFFYKSFWRDPEFIKLYLGKQIDTFIDLLTSHCGTGLRILDIGCGAGYMSLELARNGFHVTAIDISSESIAIAKEILRQNPYKDGFGSVDYLVMDFEHINDLEKTFDVILFSVSMHHMKDVSKVVEKCYELLPESKYILVHEPCHERFVNRDAAQVALIRGILSLSGLWFEENIYEDFFTDVATLNEYINDTRIEYLLERDKDEPEGQSPNDLEASGEEILNALRNQFVELDYRKSASFIYRVLGGIRGDDETIRKMANLLAVYEDVSVRNGYLHENFFYFLGRKSQ